MRDRARTHVSFPQGHTRDGKRLFHSRKRNGYEGEKKTKKKQDAFRAVIFAVAALEQEQFL